ncbi:hypothetical protein H8959_007830 [Pygathrix nigripes]
MKRVWFFLPGKEKTKVGPGPGTWELGLLSLVGLSQASGADQWGLKLEILSRAAFRPHADPASLRLLARSAQDPRERLPRANPQSLGLTWPPGLQTSQPLRAREEPRERRGPGAPGPGSAVAREGAGPQLREGGAGPGRPPRGPGTGTGRDNSFSRAPLSARPRACRLLAEAAVGRGRSRQGPTVLLFAARPGRARGGEEKLHAEGRPVREGEQPMPPRKAEWTGPSSPRGDTLGNSSCQARPLKVPTQHLQPEPRPGHDRETC